MMKRLANLARRILGRRQDEQPSTPTVTKFSVSAPKVAVKKYNAKRRKRKMSRGSGIPSGWHAAHPLRRSHFGTFYPMKPL